MRQVAVFDRLVVVAPISREVSEAFADFVREHATSLFGTAFLLCADGDAAEELVQETLVGLLPKWDLVLQSRSAPAYVRRSLVNRFVDARPDPPAGPIRSRRPPRPDARAMGCSASCV